MCRFKGWSDTLASRERFISHCCMCSWDFEMKVSQMTTLLSENSKYILEALPRVVPMEIGDFPMSPSPLCQEDRIRKTEDKATLQLSEHYPTTGTSPCNSNRWSSFCKGFCDQFSHRFKKDTFFLFFYTSGQGGVRRNLICSSSYTHWKLFPN